MKRTSLLFLVGSLLVLSCTKYDLVAPQIKFITINGLSSAIVLNAGMGYVLDYRVEDNKKIRTIQMNVTKGFQSEQNVVLDGRDFKYSNGLNPDNGEKAEQISLFVPNPSRAGSYKLTIKAEDSNGNLATPRTLNFVINHPDAPKAFVTVNTSSNELEFPVFDVKRADRIEVTGNATDANDITRVKVDILNDKTSLTSQVFDVVGNNNTSIDFETVFGTAVFRIPATAETGFYDLLVSVTSTSGHTTVMTYRLNVLF